MQKAKRFFCNIWTATEGPGSGREPAAPAKWGNVTAPIVNPAKAKDKRGRPSFA